MSWKHNNWFAFAAALLLLGGTPRPTKADEVDDAYQKFMAGRYGETFRVLFPYRLDKDHDGTLRVDFMLAVSGCHLGQYERALGGYLLSVIPSWYTPLSERNRASVDAQAAGCPLTQISESEAVSSLGGKYDLQDKATSLAPRHSGDGGAALPPAIVASPPGMGPLVDGLVYLQSDYTHMQVPSAYVCAERCSKAPQCAAMTYIKSKRECWLKKNVPGTAKSSDMISSAKVKKPVPPQQQVPH
jgi:hypothetical protein